ncbi:MAG: IgGFc-binding protein, partial [Prevotellaceae bacterium]|nr:IgGFc-binding protein [Prevotellaceae bacterium]
MTKIYALIIALCMFAGNGLYAQTTAGTDFWVAFGQNHDRSMEQLIFQIKIVTTNAAKVTLTFTDLDVNKTIYIPAGTTRTINLTPDEKVAVYSTGPEWLKKSLHITSDKPVSVYALNSAQFTSDATNILPTNVWGTDYYHISYTGYTGNVGTPPISVDYRDAITIVGTAAGTKATCISRTDTITRDLGAGSTWYIKANKNTDLTGWHITSNKPIAYFVTHQGAMIPDKANSNPDNLFQQLAPTTSWGTRFFVPDVGITRQYPLLVRVMASQNGTKITHKGGTVKSGSLSLKKGEFVTLSISNTGCFISSNNPVGVCSYLISYENDNDTLKSDGGPAMVWIPPVEQSVTSTTVSSFQTFTKEFYAIVVTPESTRKNTTVTINGKTTSLNEANWTSRAGYSYIRYRMTSDNPHTFSNHAGLTGLVMGLGDSESYYYLGGSSMYNLEMKFSVNGENFQDIFGKTICKENVELKAEILYADKVSGYPKWYIDGNLETSATEKLSWNVKLSPGKRTIT